MKRREKEERKTQNYEVEDADATNAWAKEDANIKVGAQSHCLSQNIL